MAKNNDMFWAIKTRPRVVACGQDFRIQIDHRFWDDALVSAEARQELLRIALNEAREWPRHIG